MEAQGKSAALSLRIIGVHARVATRGDGIADGSIEPLDARMQERSPPRLAMQEEGTHGEGSEQTPMPTPLKKHVAMSSSGSEQRGHESSPQAHSQGGAHPNPKLKRIDHCIHPFMPPHDPPNGGAGGSRAHPTVID